LTGLRQALYASYPDQPLRVGLNAPLAFDASVKQLLGLLLGHSLYLIPETIRRDGQRLVEYVERMQLDVFDSTPALVEVLLRAGLVERWRSQPAILLVGGESISESLWQTLVQADCLQAYNVYGPTECTVDATLGRLVGEQPTLGRPITNG